MREMNPRGGIALDPWGGKPWQANFVDARVTLYADFRKPLGGGAMTADWAELADDGLVYSNTSYGRGDLEPAVEKVRQWGELGVWNMALWPASTDVGWWQRAAKSADQVLLWKGRIKFWTDRGRPPAANNSPLFSSCVFHWAGSVRRDARLQRFERWVCRNGLGLVVPCDSIREWLARQDMPFLPAPRNRVVSGQLQETPPGGIAAGEVLPPIRRPAPHRETTDAVLSGGGLRRA